MGNFLELYGLKCIVHDKTCFKSVINPSCIDLFLTNSPNSFQNTCVISSGLSDCHKMVITVMKTTYPKAKPRKLFYRDYRGNIDADFKNDLKLTLLANLYQLLISILINFKISLGQFWTVMPL